MRLESIASIVLALGIIGCGGGGSRPFLGGNQYAGYIPSRTTTYTGTLTDQRNVVDGTATTVVQPDGSFVMTSTYGPGYTITGNLQDTAGGEVFPSIFTYVPSAYGEWYGQAVTPGTIYRGGGSWVFSGTSLTAQVQFAGGGISYLGMRYDANVSG